MPKWDKGVDYARAYGVLSRLLRRYEGKKQQCYCAILLLQLRNGLRISEAVDAFTQYIKHGGQELEIDVRKKRRTEKRKVVIPPELASTRLDHCWVLFKVDRKRLVDRVKHWCIYNFDVNTHSLRYAFITYLLKQGVNPAIVGKITRHSRLDYILTYTQEKAAEEILRNI